jgi:hypothetical protein
MHIVDINLTGARIFPRVLRLTVSGLRNAVTERSAGRDDDAAMGRLRSLTASRMQL